IEEEAKARVAAAALTPTPGAASPAPSTATATSPSTQPPPASGAPPGNTAFDGTYSGQLRFPGGAGHAGRVDASLRVTNGRGAGTLSAPGCSPSPFTLAVQPAGKVLGEGSFNCVAGYNASTPYLSGPFTIDGSHEDKSLRLTFRPERGLP